jgi:hypothetical protein
MFSRLSSHKTSLSRWGVNRLRERFTFSRRGVRLTWLPWEMSGAVGRNECLGVERPSRGPL